MCCSVAQDTNSSGDEGEHDHYPTPLIDTAAAAAAAAATAPVEGELPAESVQDANNSSSSDKGVTGHYPAPPVTDDMVKAAIVKATADLAPIMVVKVFPPGAAVKAVLKAVLPAEPAEPAAAAAEVRGRGAV